MIRAPAVRRGRECARTRRSIHSQSGAKLGAPVRAAAHGLHRGTQVDRGEVLGHVGASGLATGPHLYFELYEGRTRVDPTDLDPVIVPMQVSARERPRFSTFVHTLTRREAAPVPSSSPRAHRKAAS